MHQSLAVLFCVSVLAAMATVAHAHPYDDFEPASLPDYYQEETNFGSPDWNTGDMQFVYSLSPSSLTRAERFIIAGGQDSRNEYLQPWYREVCMAALAYEDKTGHLPAVLDEQAISVIADGQPNQPHLEMLRSPITGEYPRLDSAAFSPGNVYMRRLTAQEKAKIASVSTLYDGLWNAGMAFSGEARDYVPITLLSDAYYCRFYGENGVIFANLMQLWLESSKL